MKHSKNLQADDPSITAIGGNGYIRSELANIVLTGTYRSLGIALLVIFILLSLIFRSVSAGLLGIIPLSISVLVLFGLMGLTGIKLDVATALLSSVMIGVGVDYSIHFLWRYREERQQNRLPKEAVITTINTTGRGIIFNALVCNCRIRGPDHLLLHPHSFFRGAGGGFHSQLPGRCPVDLA